jgi:RNA polymerase sigma-70 factor, ECF subfamily
VSLSEFDRNLLDRVLQKKPRAWEDFVDRFMGLIVHVADHTAQSRNVQLQPQDRDDLCSEVFLTLIKGDYAALRRFRRLSSLATYLAVIARRVVVHQLLDNGATAIASGNGYTLNRSIPDTQMPVEQRIEDREEVERLLGLLTGTEAQVVRMYHLEGKNYFEISLAVGMAENSIGPILSRARAKLRDQVQQS